MKIILAFIIALSIATLVGCTSQPENIGAEDTDSSRVVIFDTSTLQPQPTLEEFINAQPRDSSYMVRDLESEEILHVEDRDGILVLRRAWQILDTFSTRDAEGGMYEHQVENFDSTFLVR